MSPFPLGIVAASGVEAVVSGSFDLLETTRLSSTSTLVTFNNLVSAYSSDYDSLQIRAVVKNTANAGTGGFQIRFNQDQGNNYDYHAFRAYNGSITSSAGTGLNYLNAGFQPHSTYQYMYGGNILDILYPWDATRTAVIRNHSFSLSYAPITSIWGALWENTNPIDQIDLFAEGGNSFAVGSRYSLYGLRKT